MDKSFDLSSLLMKHRKQHKIKPLQFESVAGGVQKRLDDNLKFRKGTRLTSFDCARNLPEPSPEVKSKAPQVKPDRRRQLEKWKEEKENKKRLLEKQKKKPFISAVKPHNPLKYVPPPPHKAMPSTSGCVTRSQTARNKKEEVKPPPQLKSFAPKNARFHAPALNTLSTIPQAPVKTKKINVSSITFNPILPTTSKPIVKLSRSNAYNKIANESRLLRNASKTTKTNNSVFTKPIVKSKVVQSSSSSETEKSQMQTSASSSDNDLSTKIVRNGGENNTSENIPSTDNESSHSLKYIESSSSSELENEKHSATNKTRKSVAVTSSATKSKVVTPYKSVRATNQAKILATPKNPVPKSESSSEEKLRGSKSPSLKTPEQIVEEFKKISPCVTMSRGKANARKEMLKKMEEGLFEEDESDMESVEYFHRQLTSETKRITEMCNVWEDIYEQISLPESVQELVLGTVGQARLLMSQKMQQFASLVQRCEKPETGVPLVTPADLQGFWDMVYLQVVNVDMRFKELEGLKARNWTEETAPVTAAVPRRAARRTAAGPARTRTAPAPPRAHLASAQPNRLRDMIAAARKSKAQTVETQSPHEQKTFEAGFFSVRSPARSPAPRSPCTPARDRSNLLKVVLSNEAQKASASKLSASYAMMRASSLGKCVDCDMAGIGPLPQTPTPNLQATPGRSILKQASVQSVKMTNKKIRQVIFDHSDVDSDHNNSIDEQSTLKEAYEAKEASAEMKCTEESTTSNEFKQEHVSSDMDGKKVQENKENRRTSRRLRRQNAVSTPDSHVKKHIVTREQKEREENSPSSEKKTSEKKRSVKKALAESNVLEDIVQDELLYDGPRMMTRRLKKSLISPQPEQIPKDRKTPRSEKAKRSTRKSLVKNVAEVGGDVDEKTPRTSRRRKTLLELTG